MAMVVQVDWTVGKRRRGEEGKGAHSPVHKLELGCDNELRGMKGNGDKKREPREVDDDGRDVAGDGAEGGDSRGSQRRTRTGRRWSRQQLRLSLEKTKLPGFGASKGIETVGELGWRGWLIPIHPQQSGPQQPSSPAAPRSPPGPSAGGRAVRRHTTFDTRPPPVSRRKPQRPPHATRRPIRPSLASSAPARSENLLWALGVPVFFVVWFPWGSEAVVGQQPKLVELGCLGDKWERRGRLGKASQKPGPSPQRFPVRLVRCSPPNKLLGDNWNWREAQARARTPWQHGTGVHCTPMVLG
ncbi:hypothetical protein BGZ61DRAFT_477149 [Ilyonectria robusta]|uniref:uncharacterized protein n=1 Tax=Ilyonectria robusta TaxID=1079257 RepID=UPI001E8EC4A9|nr:uncharacterized protein BGZ61DRAFT_477149 [Ilyonectria robusta]KAH8706512.1 hypothetical protein BGZ61DRAFT_477149 [Ilyonectria robusta]